MRRMILAAAALLAMCAATRAELLQVVYRGAIPRRVTYAGLAPVSLYDGPSLTTGDLGTSIDASSAAQLGFDWRALELAMATDARDYLVSGMGPQVSPAGCCESGFVHLEASWAPSVPHYLLVVANPSALLTQFPVTELWAWTTAVPEPCAFALVATASLAVYLPTRRRRRVDSACARAAAPR